MPQVPTLSTLAPTNPTAPVSTAGPSVTSPITPVTPATPTTTTSPSGFVPLTPEQYSAARQKFTPQQIMQFESQRKSTYAQPDDSQNANTAENFGLGVAKTELNQATGFANSPVGGAIKSVLGQTAGRFVNLFSGKGFTPMNVETNNNGTYKINGAAQGAGGIAADTAEFLAPVGGEAKAASVLEDSVKGLNLVEKFGPKLGKAIETAMVVGGKSAISGVSAGAVGTLQTDNLKSGVKTGLYGALAVPVIEGISTTAKAVLPGITSWLTKSSLKLTPTETQKFGSKLEDVTNYLSGHNIIGSDESRLKKVTQIYDQKENQIQSALTNDAKNVTIPRDNIVNAFESIKADYANDRDVNSIERQIDDAIAAIKRQPENVPVASLNEFKRSTFKGAYNNTGLKVSDGVESDIGDKSKEIIDQTMKDSNIKINGQTFNDFNKEYGTVINAKKALTIAARRPGAKLGTKIISSIIGAGAGSVFGPPGEAVGAAIGPTIAKGIGSSPIKTATAALVKGGSKVASPSFLSKSAKVALPFTENTNGN